MHSCLGGLDRPIAFAMTAERPREIAAWDARRNRLEWLNQVSPVGTIAAVSTIRIMLLSGARVQCNTPFGTVKP